MTSLPPELTESPSTPSSEHLKPSRPLPQEQKNSQEAPTGQATNPAPSPQPDSQQTHSNPPPNIPPQLAARSAAGFPFAGSPVPVMIPLSMMQAQQQAQTSLRLWQGQYPPPEAVEHYEKLLPGSFDRIIAMTEELQKAQIEEAKEIRIHTNASIMRGLNLGFITTVFAMAGALYCAHINSPVVAGLFLGVPVMAVARSLVESARKEKTSDIVKAATKGNSAPESIS